MPYIFNIIAELCSTIIHSCSVETFIRYSCISPVAKRQILNSIYREIGLLFTDKIPEGTENVYISQLFIRQLKESDLDDAFFRSLKGFIDDTASRADLFTLICLCQILDESLGELVRIKIAEYQENSYSVVLNTNREITGIGLLPRCSCIWERRHRLSYSNSQLHNYLFHLLLLENSILDEIVDVHYYLKEDFFPAFSRNKELKIAATPLCLEQCYSEEFFEENNVQYFRISYSGDDFSSENTLIWEKIRAAAGKGSDIIVFPEMLGNPRMIEFIQEKLRALPSAERQSMPSMIILPSVWEKKYSRNTVTVLSRDGEILCRQNKQIPYRMEKNGQAYLEGIRSNQVIHIFHYEGVGRIAILICKDFLTTNYMEQLMRSFKLSLIIVPSFSTGSYDFRQSFDLCAHDDCNVVWINSCAAMEKGKEANFENIGYVRKRIGRSDDEAQKLSEMPICSGAFEGKCAHDCIYYDVIRGV